MTLDERIDHIRRHLIYAKSVGLSTNAQHFWQDRLENLLKEKRAVKRSALADRESYLCQRLAYLASMGASADRCRHILDQIKKLQPKKEAAVAEPVMVCGQCGQDLPKEKPFQGAVVRRLRRAGLGIVTACDAESASVRIMGIGPASIGAEWWLKKDIEVVHGIIRLNRVSDTGSKYNVDYSV